MFLQEHSTTLTYGRASCCEVFLQKHFLRTRLRRPDTDCCQLVTLSN